MNWRTGLLRLWMIGTAAWLIGWTLFVRQKCYSTSSGSFWCVHDSETLKGLRGPSDLWGPLELYLLGAAVPLAVLLAGAIVVWAMRRRQR
jgi:hypothetical protein